MASYKTQGSDVVLRFEKGIDDKTFYCALSLLTSNTAKGTNECSITHIQHILIKPGSSTYVTYIWAYITALSPSTHSNSFILPFYFSLFFVFGALILLFFTKNNIKGNFKPAGRSTSLQSSVSPHSTHLVLCKHNILEKILLKKSSY